VLRIEARLEPTDDFRLVLRARKDGNCTILDRDERLVRVIGCEMTARAPDPAGWPVIQQFNRVRGRESTDGGELFTMGVTANQRNREFIQKQD